MKNFNLRYECNDARDDYSAKLKTKEDKDGIFPSWATNNVLKDLDPQCTRDCCTGRVLSL
jgi:hypothetical protein